MKITHGENFADLASELQYQWILVLRDTLKKHGIPAATAKEICGDFTFDFSMLLDQGEIAHRGKSYSPRIAFSPCANEDALIMNDGTLEVHEYAFGNTGEAYKSS